jgi:hypothetical protein
VVGPQSPFDVFLQRSWADHGDHPEDVARRLDDGYALVENPAQIAALARILAHVDGEHLARWAEGAKRLERLRSHARWRDEGDGAIVVRRLIGAMRLGAGVALDPALEGVDLAHAHAAVASAFAAQNRAADAIRHFRAARAAMPAGLPDGEPAIRALAVASNNLASTLEERPARSPDEDAAMLEAAHASRECWERAGGWLEAERAEYMLAKCELAAGNAAGALAHARACAALCAANDADAFERFFAQGALALAHRALGDARAFDEASAAAHALHAALAPDLRRWCEPTLRLL